MDQHPALRLFLAVAAPLLVLFLLTSQGDVDRLSPDPVAAAAAAWSAAEHGTLDLKGADVPENPWLLEWRGQLLSNRTPGVIAFGVPAAAVASVVTDDFSLWPERVTAAVVSAAAAGVLALLVLELGATRRQAGWFAGLAAVATGTWAVSSDALWTHGPDQLLLLCALLAVARKHLWVAGACFGVMATVRLHLVVVAFTVGVGLALSRRDWRPLLQVGLPSALGVGAVLLYGKVVFGLWSVAPGYAAIGQPTADNVLNGGAPGVSSSAREAVANVLGALVSPDRGVLVVTPVLLVLLLRVVPAWRVAPDWARWAAVGGLAYFVVQSRLNHFTGGIHFYGNRLTLEPVTLLAPLLWLAWRTRTRGSGFERAVQSTLCLSIGSQVLGALWVTPDGLVSEWRHTYVVEIFDTDLYPAVCGPFVLLTLLLAAALVLRRPARPASRPEVQPVPS